MNQRQMRFNGERNIPLDKLYYAMKGEMTAGITFDPNTQRYTHPTHAWSLVISYGAGHPWILGDQEECCIRQRPPTAELVPSLLAANSPGSGNRERCGQSSSQKHVAEREVASSFIYNFMAVIFGSSGGGSGVASFLRFIYHATCNITLTDSLSHIRV